jgi:hypothetical protein
VSIDYADEFAEIVAGFYTATAEEPERVWECERHEWVYLFGDECPWCLENARAYEEQQAEQYAAWQAEEFERERERKAIEPEVRALRNRYVREAEERGEVLTQYRKKKIREQAVREIRQKYGMRNV